MMDNMITITTEDGREIDCQILFTYHSEDFMHDYVVFKDPNSNTAGACIYTPTDNGKGTLSDIESDEEWELLQDVLNDWLEQNADKLDSCASCGGACECGGSCKGCEEE